MTRMRSTSNSSAQAQNAARPSNGTPGDFNMRAGKAVKRVGSTGEGQTAIPRKTDRSGREIVLCNVGCFKREAGIATAPDSLQGDVE